MKTRHCLLVPIIAASCTSAPVSTPRISPTGLGYVAPVPARTVPDDGWVDPAPHRAFGVVTAPGVKIHVLDYGGPGTPMIFLSGIGNNAHVWDDFARRFMKDHHVIAITRRGFGESSHPDTGYDQPTLARDIHAVMDSMNIRRAVLVGHSIGGYELSHFGAMYPDRVIGLIYLDAGADRVAEDSIRKAFGAIAQPTSQTSPSPQRIMPTDADSASPKAAWAYRQRVGLTDNTEQAVRASYFYEGFNPYLGNYNPVPAKMLAEIAAGERTPFAKVLAPAIFIFAGTNDPVALAHRQFISRELKGSETVSIPGARHLIFISHPDLVERYMKQFMSKLSDTRN